MHLGQPLWNFLNACFFEYGIAAYDLELGRGGRQARPRTRSSARSCSAVLGKIRSQVTKDYVVHPLLSRSGRSPTTLAANVTANMVRNLWSHSVIMCGHFPEGVETFEKSSIDGETRGEWYLRQMLGSANISGSKLMHIMTGNLSHQIEHHLFPDLPSNRYGEIAPQVQDLFERYGLRYYSAPAAAAGRLGLAQGGPAVAAQRLARPDHAGQRTAAGPRAGPDDGGRRRGAAGARGGLTPGARPGRRAPRWRHGHLVHHRLLHRPRPGLRRPRRSSAVTTSS